MAAAKNAFLRNARSFSSNPILPTPGITNKMPIQMWWDIDTRVPFKGFVKSKIENISKVLRRLDFHGPMKVEAFGDTELLCAETRKELADAVNVVNHVPTGVDLSLAMANGMLDFCRQNPPPACHYFLTGNRDLVPLMDELKSYGYCGIFGF